MLSDKSVASGSEVAQLISNRGLYLGVKNDSALDVLVSAMRPLQLQNGQEISQEVRLAATPFEGGFDNHSASLIEISQGISNRLGKNISFIRNTINPLVMEIMGRCAEDEARLRADSPLNVNVRMYDAAPAYFSPILEQYLGNAKMSSTTRVTFPRELITYLTVSLNDQMMVDLLMSSNDAFNAQLQGVIADTLRNGGAIKYALFQETPLGPNNVESWTRHDSLITYMFLRGINAGRHPSVNINDMTAEERLLIAKGMNYYGNLVYRQIMLYQRAFDVKQMFLGYEAGARTVAVIDRNYNDWLKNGGSAEALIGYLLTSGNGIAGAETQLRQQPDRYAELFTQRANMLRNENAILAAQQVERIVEDELINYIKTHSDAQAEMQESLNRLRELRRNYRYYATQDRLDYIRYMVCEIVGRGTDSMMMLTGIDMYQKNNPDATIQQAAIYATARLVARWLASQIKVTAAPDNRMGISAETESRLR